MTREINAVDVLMNTLTNIEGTTTIERVSTVEIEKVLLKERLLQVLPYPEIEQLDPVALLNFMYKFGIYALPTTELIDFLKSEIVGAAIEIGAGNGAIARALGIPATDSYMQSQPEIKKYYEMMGQAVIDYPADVIKMEAIAAIKHYNPATVIGAYITHKFNGKCGNMYGPVEGKILAAGCKYINIGNDKVHADKPIMKHPHQVYRFDWLVTRSEKKLNYIKIWNL